MNWPLSLPQSTQHLHADAAEARVLRLVRRPRLTRVVARLLLTGIALFIVSLVFVPWQQNTEGKGRVVAYAPVERQQTLDAPLEGRVIRWHVREGDHVEEGQAIVDISDNDPLILDRLRNEREAQLARIEAARERVAAVAGRVGALGSSRDAAIQAAGARVRMAKDRVAASERARDAAAKAVETTHLNLERQRSLFSSGLTSKRNVELAELDSVRAETDLERARAAVSAARSEEAALFGDQLKTGNDLEAMINDATGSKASAQADIASANAELARIEVRLARQVTQEVKAPRAGVIFRVVAKQGGEIVKAGDILAYLVPDTAERAVELWIDGNDIPLVTPGRNVRLQFEGWPAVQFAGWPNVAVGTFAGTVAVVDPAADGAGKFRVLVVPAEPWPAPRFLRQGAQANAWILLDRVRLGYELWRRLNGFPPVLPTGDMFHDGPAQKEGGAGK